MKIAILADTHWGVRNESQNFLRQAEDFHDEFFRYLADSDVKTIVHLGDLVDRRKYVNYQVARSIREHFFRPIVERDMRCIFIAGNHDVYYNNTSEVNALRELVPGTHHFVVHDDEPGVAEFNGVRWLMLPWINQSNYDSCMKAIETSGAQYCAAHLELKGFEMYRGQLAEHGMDASIFAGFNRVLTGHYHTQSIRGNVHYVGAPYQMVWSDYDDPRGFWVFDTDTHQFDFVQNDQKMFHKVHVTDETYAYEPGSYADKVVKLIVPADVDQVKFERLLRELEAEQPGDVQVVDDHLNMDVLDEVEVHAEVGDTLKLLQDCVESLGEEVDKIELTRLLTDLYREAQTTGA